MINIYPLTNIYEKPLNSSKLASQMIYGEKFSIITKNKGWLKIKTSFDNYVGYIKSKNFSNKLHCNYKVAKLKSKIYKKVNNQFKPTKKFLYFVSRIKAYNFNKHYLEYEKNKWIKKSNIKTPSREYLNNLKLQTPNLLPKVFHTIKPQKGIFL